MEAIQPASAPIAKVLSDRMSPLLNGSTIPDGWSVTSEDSLTPRLLSFKSNSSAESYSEGSGRALSRSNRHISAPNAENNYMEYLDLMKLEVDAQLDKLKGDVTGLETYALPDNVYIIGTHLGMSLDVMLIEIDERFNALKLLLAVVFRQAREMLDLANPSVTDLQWEHELQLEIISITVGECITGLQEELERKLYEQISVTNTMSKNWMEAVAHFAGMREDLGTLSKLLFPSVPESHISHSKSEGSGSKSGRWKLFGKKTKEDHASSRTEGSKSLRKQKSMVISEKSDFRHLNAMTKEETISYFKSEISKLKRVHESALLEKTEELFKLKREKGSLALQNDVEFEPLRKKIPQIIARMDQIISKNIKAPSQYKTHNELDEKCRLASRIDSLYYDNQHLRGLLADNMKVKELSSQLSEASRDMSLQLSSEEELLRQIEKSKEEWEDLRIEGDVRDGLYCTVTKSLLDDSVNDMHNAALGFDAKLSSLEAVISEKESALLLSYDENQKLKEKLEELEKDMSLQLSSEEELLRQIEKSKEEREDLQTEYDVRDGLYRTISRNLLHDTMNSMHDAALGFDAKLSSLEAVMSEKEKALCLSYEEIGKLKEKLADLEEDMSLQLSSEEELLRQIEKIKEEREDLQTEYDVRDGLYCTVSRNLLDDSMNSMHDAALGFDAKLCSLEAVISEKEKALCLSYEENGKLKEKLAELEKDMSLQLSSEEELLRQIEKSKEEREDLRTEYDVRDGLYRTVSRNLRDDSMNSMHAAALGFDAKLSSLEAVISEKEKALCLSYEENGKLKERLGELEKGYLFQEHQEDPEVIKQESAKMILRDIEVEPQTSPGRLHESPKLGLQYDELLKLNGSNIDYGGALSKNGQEKQLECILVSIMKLSKEFVEIEKKLSTDRTENRSEDLSDHCSHMVKQAVVLTKVGTWYKQMLEARRSELHKAEAKVVILGDKVNAHLSLLEKIYVTLDHYSPTLQRHPALLDAFLKTCKLVAGLRSIHDEEEETA